MEISKNVSLLRCFLNRVLAPEGEILSFAPPKESIQRKGGPVAAHVLRSSYLSGGGKRGFLPLCRRAASLPHPLRANPDKYCGARRGKRGKTTLLRNVSYLLSIKPRRTQRTRCFLVFLYARLLPSAE
jgi:hypothetical protein